MEAVTNQASVRLVKGGGVTGGSGCYFFTQITIIVCISRIQCDFWRTCQSGERMNTGMYCLLAVKIDSFNCYAAAPFYLLPVNQESTV